jgi:NTE family protein
VDADLVLEGGGVKGIGLVGAITELHRAGYGFHRIAGTSAGAIVGSILAAGMSPQRMGELVRQIPYQSFADPVGIGRVPVIGRALALVKNDGLYGGDVLLRWLEDHLAELGVHTFGDLRLDDDLIPENQRWKLVVIAADISDGRLVRLPWDYPDYGLDPDAQSVAAAIRASASIPFFFAPVRLQTSGGATAILVDGGLLSDFPVDTFDRPRGEQPRWPTFGIKLSAPPGATPLPKPIPGGPLGVAFAIAHTLTSFHDRMHLSDPCVLARTCFIDTGKVNSVDFDISSAAQQQLFESGQRAARAFLDTWDWPLYLARCRMG